MQLDLLLHQWNQNKLVFLHNNTNIKSIRFYQKGVAIDSNTLYLLDSTKFLTEKHPAGNFLLYATNPPIELSKNTEDNIIIIEENRNLLEDMNELLSILDRFQKYYDKLYLYIAQNAELDDFIYLIYEFFETKLCILDKNKKLIYNILDFKSVEKIFPLEIQKTNLKRIYGYLGFENTNPLYDSEIEKTAKILGPYLFNRTNALINSKDHFYQSLKNLFQDAFRETDYENLRNITWDLEDDYEIYMMELENGLYYYKNMFINGNRFALDHPMYMYSIIENNKLICLINHKNKSSDTLLQNLGDFVEEYKLKHVRVSLHRNLLQYSKTVSMAKMLLDHNIKLEGPLEKQLNPLVYELAVRFASLEYFIPRELQMLKDHDEKNHSDLLKTLYFYLLEERSLIKASERLNVHRNSIVYRTNKINEIIDIDLDDTDTRSNLLSALEIMYRCGLVK